MDSQRRKRLLVALLLVAAAAWALGTCLRGREAVPVRSTDAARTSAPARAKDSAVPENRPTSLTTASSVAPPPRAASVPAPAPHASSRELFRAGWGSGPTDVGRARARESNPEGPMAILSGPLGETYILDQENRRILIRKGDSTRAVPLPSEGVQDLALLGDGRVATLDRLVDRSVAVLGPGGEVISRIPIVGPGLPEGGGTTGLFSTKDGIYVEREHGVVVRIADASGVPDVSRPEKKGRPSRDGRMWLRAAMSNREMGLGEILAYDATTEHLVYQTTIRFDAPILHIVMLDSDQEGRAYLAAETARLAASPPYVPIAPRIEVVQVERNGTPRARVLVPSSETVDEMFRPLSITDDGRLIAMRATQSGLIVEVYTFAP